MMKSFVHNFAVSIIVLVGIVGCDQYEYSSPYPGTVQLNLKAKYTQFDATETAFQTNNFTITITSVKAVRDDGVRANIYQDIKAIGRKPDTHNLLGKSSYDSSEVIGQYPLPPGRYIGLEILMEPSRRVILDGYRFIDVVEPQERQRLVSIKKEFTIEEYRTTVITITIDLDLTLQKLAYEYLYRPYIYVSSVRTY